MLFVVNLKKVGIIIVMLFVGSKDHDETFLRSIPPFTCPSYHRHQASPPSDSAMSEVK